MNGDAKFLVKQLHNQHEKQQQIYVHTEFKALTVVVMNVASSGIQR
jgi:hypothetical protein